MSVVQQQAVLNKHSIPQVQMYFTLILSYFTNQCTAAHNFVLSISLLTAYSYAYNIHTSNQHHELVQQKIVPFFNKSFLYQLHLVSEFLATGR